MCRIEYWKPCPWAPLALGEKPKIVELINASDEEGRYTAR